MISRTAERTRIRSESFVADSPVQGETILVLSENAARRMPHLSSCIERRVWINIRACLSSDRFIRKQRQSAKALAKEHLAKTFEVEEVGFANTDHDINPDYTAATSRAC